MRRAVLLVLLSSCSTEQTEPPAPGCAGEGVWDGELCVPAHCGVGAWGELAADDNTIYVDGAAMDGGDGSVTTPLRTLQAGVDLAAERGGAMVAVAAGTYVENVHMGDGYRDVVVVGRCKELVTVDGGGGRRAATFAIVGEAKRPEVSLRGLTLTGGTLVGLDVEDAEVTAEDVEIVAGSVRCHADGY